MDEMMPELPEDAPEILKKFVRLTELSDMIMVETDIVKLVSYAQEMSSLWQYVMVYIMQNVASNPDAMSMTMGDVGAMVFDPNVTI